MAQHESATGLRWGYTTGTCAAGASMAAVLLLYRNTQVQTVSVATNAPDIPEVLLDIDEHSVTAEYAQCAVVKDAGDDPDVTHGIRIYARAEKRISGIDITGGRGVGRVTRKGMQCQPGEYAINPAPMRMIHDAVSSVLPDGCGVRITITVPEGERIAEKTFNKRLGIEGGISILGTTGIVRPMSVEALTESICLEMNMARESGAAGCILVPGAHGETFARMELGIQKMPVVHISNYPGEALSSARLLGFQRICIVGHIGKMIKISAGIFQTHSSVSDARLEILAAHFAHYTRDIDAVRKIQQCTTTDEALDIAGDNPELYTYIAHRCAEHCCAHIDNALTVDTVLYSFSRGYLGATIPMEEMHRLWQ